MILKHRRGSCHCRRVQYEASGAIRFYQANLEQSKRTSRCHCSLCEAARGWFMFIGGKDFSLLQGENSLSSDRWTSTGNPDSLLTYHFCTVCGVPIYATGDAEFMGGRFYALAVSTLDDVTADEPAIAPLNFISRFQNRFDRVSDERSAVTTDCCRSSD